MLHAFFRRSTLLRLGVLMMATLGCNSTEQSTSAASQKHFSILTASTEVWHHGRPGGGSGIDYRLTAVIRTAEKLQFDSLWIAETSRTFPVEAVRLKGPVTAAPFTFSQGDTIGLYAAATLMANQPGGQNINEAGRIWYTCNGKKGYQSIPIITQVQTDPRPQQPR